MTRARRSIPAVVTVAACVSFVAFPGRADPPRASAQEDVPLGDVRALVRAVARRYKSWSRVDDELRWAPWLCRMPLPSFARLSAATPASPHGRKLYFVYARDRAAYIASTPPSGRGRPVEIGQLVVKEAFVPRRMTESEARARATTSWARWALAQERGTSAFIAAERDGLHYGPGAAAGIYVLAKSSHGGRDTDHGWIYGTVTANGRVTSSGRVASCMSCHVDAPHERLFGTTRPSDR